MQKRAIFFDIDGVMVHGFHFRPELRRRWDEHLKADLGIAPAVFQEVFFKGVFDEVVTGRKSMISALDEVLPQLGYAGSAMDLAQYWLTRDSHVNRPLLSAIRQLRGLGHKLYLATNQEHMRALHLWHTLGFSMVFDDIFYSARLGVKKPEAGFFAKVAEFIGPQEQAPLLFDDTPDVVHAAQAAGWEAVLYNSLDDFTQHPFISNLIQKL